MSTDLEQRLREAFADDAERARLAHPGGPPPPEARPLSHERPGRRGPRWLAVAAVAAVLALVGALTLLDDDATVETVPSGILPRPSVQVLPDVGTIASGSGCPFAISGDPVDMQPGPGTGRFSTEGGQGVAHILLGAQLAEVHVPGFARNGGDPRREERVELERGPAIVWLDGPESSSREGAGNLPFVQVSYVAEGDEPCSSFTVTVDGGTEDANRQAAVDLADRVLLPADLEDLDLPGAEGGPVAGLELAGTEWLVAYPSAVGVDLRMSFTDSTVRWANGCATERADYELDRAEGILTLSDRSSTDPGCTPPPPSRDDLRPSSPWPVIETVMGAERISMNLIDGQLYLGDRFDLEGDYILLVPPSPSTSDLPALPDPGRDRPTDPVAAEAEVRAAFMGLFDASIPREDRTQFVDRPEVWLPANKALMEGQYGQALRDLHAVVDDVVFTSPTHASVRFQLLASDPIVPRDHYIGDALLVDGRWVVDVTTPCARVATAGVECDLTP
jgi:hypothetical protein